MFSCAPYGSRMQGYIYFSGSKRWQVRVFHHQIFQRSDFMTDNGFHELKRGLGSVFAEESNSFSDQGKKSIGINVHHPGCIDGLVSKLTIVDYSSAHR